MSENESIDIGKYNKQEEFDNKPSAGTKQLAGKEFRISKYKHTRGKPNKNSRESDIGADGKVDYYTIETVETFNVSPRKDAPEEPIQNYFVTKAISNQIERALANESVAEAFKSGQSLGPVKIAKKQNSDSSKNDYWALIFPHETEYKNI